MAYKFRRWRIKWNRKEKRFKKIRRDRQKSREAHLRFKRNRGKMKQALRKTRIKSRITRKKNKAMGIYRKLAIARKRWKNILKSDMNLDRYINYQINEELDINPEIEVDINDLEDIKYAMRQIGRNVIFDNKEEKEDFDNFVKDALDIINSFKDVDELDEDDHDLMSDIISFIEEFGEEAGLLSHDDEDAEDVKNED